MTWYKNAYDMRVETFEDRNVLNAKVLSMTQMVEQLQYIAEVVFQTSRLAKRINAGIMNDQKMSSYPKIRDILIEADRICIDNPWRFKLLCQAAIIEINNKMKTLVKQRNDFTIHLQNKWRKGWFGKDDNRE